MEGPEGRTKKEGTKEGDRNGSEGRKDRMWWRKMKRSDVVAVDGRTGHDGEG